MRQSQNIKPGLYGAQSLAEMRKWIVQHLSRQVEIGFRGAVLDGNSHQPFDSLQQLGPMACRLPLTRRNERDHAQALEPQALFHIARAANRTIKISENKRVQQSRTYANQKAKQSNERCLWVALEIRPRRRRYHACIRNRKRLLLHGLGIFLEKILEDSVVCLRGRFELFEIDLRLTTRPRLLDLLAERSPS